jgi:hypothetical protein
MVFVWIILATIVLMFGIVVIRGAPYVPSRTRYISQALTDLYPLSESDTLVDIGSGDGVVLRSVSKLGAKAVGFEINPILFVISWLLSFGDKKVSIKLADIWLSHLPATTTVVYIFSTSGNMKKIKKWLQSEVNRMNQGVTLVSYGFTIPGVNVEKKLGAYYLYKFSPLHAD